MVWLGRDLKYHHSSIPCLGQGHPPLHQATQPGPGHFQVQGCVSFKIEEEKNLFWEG